MTPGIQKKMVRSRLNQNCLLMPESAATAAGGSKTERTIFKSLFMARWFARGGPMLIQRF